MIYLICYMYYSPAAPNKTSLENDNYCSEKSEQILLRIYFEKRKNNSNFYVSKICVFLTEGQGANASNAFLLNMAL